MAGHARLRGHGHASRSTEPNRPIRDPRSAFTRATSLRTSFADQPSRLARRVAEEREYRLSFLSFFFLFLFSFLSFFPLLFRFGSFFSLCLVVSFSRSYEQLEESLLTCLLFGSRRFSCSDVCMRRRARKLIFNCVVF